MASNYVTRRLYGISSFTVTIRLAIATYKADERLIHSYSTAPILFHRDLIVARFSLTIPRRGRFSFYELAWLNVEYESSDWHLSHTNGRIAMKSRNVKRFISDFRPQHKSETKNFIISSVFLSLLSLRHIAANALLLLCIQILLFKWLLLFFA